MHEFSVAVAILDIARRHVPAGTSLQRVAVVAGPMRRIDPDAMQFAWQQAVAGSADAEAALDLTVPPWQLLCGECGRRFESDELYVNCQCGCDHPMPVGGDELQLTSLTVSDPEDQPQMDTERFGTTDEHR